MRNHEKKDRSGWRNLILSTIGIVALAVPISLCLVTAARLRAQAPTAQSPAVPQRQINAGDKPAFEVTSVKRNSSEKGGVMRPPADGRYSATNAPLRSMVMNAYGLGGTHQLSAAPEWDRLLSERFDIEAKAEGNPSRDQMWVMLQSLLEDRFKLVVHHETRQLPIYGLVLSKAGKTGPQLTAHSEEAKKCVQPGPGQALSPPPAEQQLPAFCGYFVTMQSGAMHITGNKIGLDLLARNLTGFVDRAVVDRTGPSGFFDVTLEFVPTQGLASPTGTGVDASELSDLPSLFTALQEQLGLKLVPQTGPIDFLVIDHVEEPSPN